MIIRGMAPGEGGPPFPDMGPDVCMPVHAKRAVPFVERPIIRMLHRFRRAGVTSNTA